MDFLYVSGVHSKLQVMGKNTSNRDLGNMIGLTVTKSEIFEKVVTVDDFFLVIYFIDEIMRITHAKFQEKILNIVVEVEHFEDD